MSKLHWLALTTVPGIGGATARRLLERFGSAEAIWEATEEQLEQVPRVSSKMAAELRAVSWLAVEEELEHLEHEGLGILTWDDVDYPVNLREVSDAPFLLFVRGELQSTALIAQGAEPLEPSSVDFDALTLRVDTPASEKTEKQLNLWRL